MLAELYCCCCGYRLAELVACCELSWWLQARFCRAAKYTAVCVLLLVALLLAGVYVMPNEEARSKDWTTRCSRALSAHRLQL